MGFTILIGLVYNTHFAHADITTSLIGWYKLDEGSGTTAIDSGTNAFNGVNTNGTYTSASKIGPFALSYSAGYTNVLSDILPAMGPTTPFTESAWIFVPTYQNTRQELTFAPALVTGNFAADIFLDSSNQINLNSSIANVSNNLFTSTAIPLGQWVQVIGVWSGTGHSGGLAHDSELFVNGADIGGVNYANSGTAVSSSDWYEGAVKFAGSFIDTGTFIADDVRVYNRALTASDVTQLFNYNGAPTTVFHRFLITLGKQLSVHVGTKTKINSIN